MHGISPRHRPSGIASHAVHLWTDCDPPIHLPFPDAAGDPATLSVDDAVDSVAVLAVLAAFGVFVVSFSSRALTSRKW